MKRIGRNALGFQVFGKISKRLRMRIVINLDKWCKVGRAKLSNSRSRKCI